MLNEDFKKIFVTEGGLLFNLYKDEDAVAAFLTSSLWRELKSQNGYETGNYDPDVPDLVRILKKWLEKINAICKERGLTKEESKLIKYDDSQLANYIESIKEPTIFNIPDVISINDVWDIPVHNPLNAPVKSINTNDLKYMEYAKSIHIPKFIEPHLSMNGEFFSDCSNGLHLIKFRCRNLENISVSKENSFIKVLDGLIYSSDMKCLYMCPPSIKGCIKVPDGVKIICGHAFRYCSQISEVILPKSLTTIENDAFAESGIVNITIPEQIKEIPTWAFQNCKKLETVFLNNVTTIGHASFGGCINLKKVTGHKIEKILFQSFYGCSSIDVFEVPDSIEYDGFYNYSFEGTPISLQNRFLKDNGWFYVNDVNEKGQQVVKKITCAEYIRRKQNGLL